MEADKKKGRERRSHASVAGALVSSLKKLGGEAEALGRFSGDVALNEHGRFSAHRRVEKWLGESAFQQLCAQRQALAQLLLGFRLTGLRRRLLTALRKQRDSADPKVVQGAIVAGLRSWAAPPSRGSRRVPEAVYETRARGLTSEFQSLRVKEALKAFLTKVREAEDELRRGEDEERG